MRTMFRIALIGCSAIGLCYPAHAQNTPVDGPATEGEEVVVTGIRASLDNAARIKRDLNVVADGISAEDIGRFPDQNLAESLQRITGVQITRDRGEGSRVNIRGLSPSFTRVQFNGRSVGTTGSRSFDFKALSAEFVSGVEVYKSTTADMIEGGLAGTVNVRTARPLDIGRNRLVVSGEGVYEENSERLRPRGALLANYVTKDGRFGASFGVGYESRDYRLVSYRGYGAETGREATRTPTLDYNLDGDTLDSFTFDHAQSYWVIPGERRRLSFIGGVQARPTDGFEAYADILYTEFAEDNVKFENQTRFTNINGATAGGQYGIRASTVDTGFRDRLLSGSQGFLSVLDADGVDQRGDQQRVRQRNSIGSGAVGVRIGAGPFRIVAEGAYSLSTARSEDSNFAIISRGSIRTSRPDGLGGLPKVEFTRGYDPLDAANYNLVSMNINRSNATDENLEGRIDLSYDFEDGFISAVKVGGFAGRRQFVSGSSGVSPTAATLSRISNGAFPLRAGVEGSGGSINAASIMKTVSYAGYIPNMPEKLLVADTDAILAKLPVATILAAAPLVQRLSSGLDVTETTRAAYASVEFGRSGDAFAGNLGVRHVSTDLVSQGYAPDLTRIIIEPGGIQTTIPSAGIVRYPADYAYFLPSLNAKYALTDALVARVALGRVLGRPDLGALSSGATVNANVRSISSGNPELKPYLSDQADLSLEYYVPGGGVFTIAGFYKKLRNYIVSDQRAETYTALLRAGGTQTIDFRRSLPVNLDIVTLKGVEAGGQLPLKFLPSPFDGFGVMGSFTYIDIPETVSKLNGAIIRLEGVSKYSYNIGAYYEKYGFGIRAAYNYRGRYMGGASNFFGDFAYTRAYGQLDASISYDISRAVSLTADIANALDAKDRIDNVFGLLRDYSSIGRRITAGARMTF